MKHVITVPGDKSISHRGVMLGALAEGTTTLSGFLDGADCRATIDCFQRLGIKIEQSGDTVTIHGKGLHGLSAPSGALDVKNSGTTMRLLSGILAAQDFSCTLTGDDSIRRRPMGRIIEPLTKMGAQIRSESDNGCAPLVISPARLSGISYDSPVASAQVKSCVLLAGLYADGGTAVNEPVLSRDHTERMLAGFGAKVRSEGTRAAVEPQPVLTGQRINIPGDISSAAYWIAAGLILKDCELTIKNVNTNPTRAGILSVVTAMGGDLTLVNEHEESGEPAADIVVRSSDLHGTTFGKELIPSLIDEIPVIAVLAAAAEGETVIRDAGELKVKESDRIASITENLSAMGADVTAKKDGMIIRGGRPLHAAPVRTHGDHRIAMSFAVASLAADGDNTFDDRDCVSISYPGFWETLDKIAES